MANRYTPFRRNTGKRTSSVAIGSLAATAVLFLALPLTQLIDPPDIPDPITTTQDFALVAPVLDIIEQKPPIKKIDERKDPEYVEPVDQITLREIDDLLNNLVGDGTGPYRGTLSDDDLAELIDIYLPGELDQTPVPVFRVAPNYPYELKTSGIEGSVWLVFIVDENGRVREVRVEGSSHRGFEQPSINALRQWKFEPGRVDDRAVRTRMKIPMKFTIR